MHAYLLATVSSLGFTLAHAPEQFVSLHCRPQEKTHVPFPLQSPTSKTQSRARHSHRSSGERARESCILFPTLLLLPSSRKASSAALAGRGQSQGDCSSMFLEVSYYGKELLKKEKKKSLKMWNNLGIFSYIKIMSINGLAHWLTPIILATWEADIRRIALQSQPGQTLKTLSKNNLKIKKNSWRYSSSSGVPA
jgi:hypothetical protein